MFIITAFVLDQFFGGGTRRATKHRRGLSSLVATTLLLLLLLLFGVVWVVWYDLVYKIFNTGFRLTLFLLCGRAGFVVFIIQGPGVTTNKQGSLYRTVPTYLQRVIVLLRTDREQRTLRSIIHYAHAGQTGM